MYHRGVTLGVHQNVCTNHLRVGISAVVVAFIGLNEFLHCLHTPDHILVLAVIVVVAVPPNVRTKQLVVKQQLAPCG